MIDPEKITVSIYRSDYRILIAIAKKKDLRDRKNHPSIKEAVNFVLRDRAAFLLGRDDLENFTELPHYDKQEGS